MCAKLSEDDIKIIRFYEGDVDSDDPFWGDPKAYVTLNSLFFAGIDTEKRRVKEGKLLNPAFFDDIPRLLYVCDRLICLCEANRSKSEIATYRVERYADFTEMMDAGRTVSFTSTSASGFLRQYGDRYGIALLRFHIPIGTPCIKFGEILPKYLKADESELLLPPGLSLTFHKSDMNADEKSILDAKGEPPMCFYDADVGPFIHTNNTYKPDISDIEAGCRRTALALNAGIEPNAADLKCYLTLKEHIWSVVLCCL